jgi:HEXXH motif-containing protein
MPQGRMPGRSAIPALHGFVPSRARAAAIDRWMHDQLCDSLQHVAAACRAPVPGVAQALQPVLDRLAQGGRLPPECFGDYFELVEAVTTGDLATSLALAEAISAAGPRPTDLPVLAMGSPAAAALDAAFRRRLGKDAWLFTPVAAETRNGFARLLAAGLDILAKGLPALHAEIRQIMHVVLLAQGNDTAEVEFDGASHYQFWGLVVLNPKYHVTALEVAEVLAHESGHALLFGMMQDQLLVLNPYSERYPSPLRPDLRPMDGIFHATFVSARMAMAMEGLAVGGGLAGAERDAALAAAARDRQNFAEGDSVLRSDGRLTDTGQRIITAARRWIARPAATGPVS